ncbi:hypothetical protein ACG2LH_03415 [Zhouia sp. PK063]|uniref:hypothetical protein n=1 Tax=Zhouia sp. PK063 TaxID=3373602 RepID=UPI0037A4B9E7
MMKKLIPLALMVVLICSMASCDLTNDGTNSYTQAIFFTDDISVPDTLFVGEKSDSIKVHYELPYDCYTYQGPSYQIANDSTFIFYAQAIVTDDGTCSEYPTPKIGEDSFTFTITKEGKYYFKFLTGSDAEGNGVYETFTVPVVDEP